MCPGQFWHLVKFSVTLLAMVRYACLTIGLLVSVTSVEAADNKGEQVYLGSCIGCHGRDGSGGMPGVPDLTEKDGAMTKPDAVLLANIIKGVQTSGRPFVMPPRGGNASLTDDDLRATLRYMRRITGVRGK